VTDYAVLEMHTCSPGAMNDASILSESSNRSSNGRIDNTPERKSANRSKREGDRNADLAWLTPTESVSWVTKGTELERTPAHPG